MRLTIYQTILLALLWGLPAYSLVSPISQKSVIDSGIELTLHQDYPAVLALFTAAQRSDPDNPFFDHYLMLTYEGMMIDYESRDWEKPFDSLSKRAETAFKKLRKAEPKNAWAAFFLGSLYVTRGAHELRFSHYLNFTRSILQGINLLNEAVKLDSNLTDAYLYLGLSQYARSRLIGFLPLLDDDREASLDMVSRAVAGSSFSRAFAQQVLIGLYGHMGELGKAQAMADTFRLRYPANRAIRWIMANAYLSQNKYDDARREFEALVPLVEEIPAEHSYNRVSLDMSLALIALKTGRYSDCIAYCDKVLAVRSTDKRLKDFREMAGKYKTKSEKKLKKS